jgi:hypothetical protein
VRRITRQVLAGQDDPAREQRVLQLARLVGQGAYRVEPEQIIAAAGGENRPRRATPPRGGNRSL